MLNKNFRDNFYILEICTHNFYIHFFFFFFTKLWGLFRQFTRHVFRAFISLSNQFFGILFFLFKLPLLFHFFFFSFIFFSCFFLLSFSSFSFYCSWYFCGNQSTAREIQSRSWRSFGENQEKGFYHLQESTDGGSISSLVFNSLFLDLQICNKCYKYSPLLSYI